MSRPSETDSSVKEIIKHLESVGINSLTALEKASLDLGLCKELEQRLDFDMYRLLKLLNRHELSRIKGVDSNYIGTLKSAGIEGLTELSLCNADQLNDVFIKINAKQVELIRQPGLLKIISWIKQAKALRSKRF